MAFGWLEKGESIENDTAQPLLGKRQRYLVLVRTVPDIDEDILNSSAAGDVDELKVKV